MWGYPPYGPPQQPNVMYIPVPTPSTPPPTPPQGMTLEQIQQAMALAEAFEKTQTEKKKEREEKEKAKKKPERKVPVGVYIAWFIGLLFISPVAAIGYIAFIKMLLSKM